MNIFVSELLGTFLLVLVVLLSSNPIYIALGFLGAIILSNISGGHINPVVTIIKHMQGAISKSQVYEYMFAQTIGALLAYYIYVKYNKGS